MFRVITALAIYRYERVITDSGYDHDRWTHRAIEFKQRSMPILPSITIGDTPVTSTNGAGKAPRQMRTLGECWHKDIVSVEHLISIMDDPSKFDPSTLTNNQQWAVLFVSSALTRDITVEFVLDVVKQVIFLADEYKRVQVRIKFTQDPILQHGVERFKELWEAGSSRSRELAEQILKRR